MMPNRNDALNLLQEYNNNPAIVQHGLQVESYMRHFAKRAREDENQCKSIMDLGIKSVKKKFKSKNFVTGVNKEVVPAGVKMLDMKLDKLIVEVIKGMKNNADEIGVA